MSINHTKVLVTGASGYIASHVVVELLKTGYSVRGTVRSLKNENKYRYISDIKAKFPQFCDKLELVEADLLDADSWDDAVLGCSHVMHVASPFFLTEPKNEDDLIKPAVDGTLNVLKSCARHGVNRVVLTSSAAAILTGQTESRLYTEEDWAIVGGKKKLNAYLKSKALAEKAAWDYVDSMTGNNKIQLTTILPTSVSGAALVNGYFSSAEFFIRAFNGDLYMQPNLSVPWVDVRDVARAHVLALENEASIGNRYLCTAGNLALGEFITMLGEEFRQYGYNLKKRNLPTCVVKFAALFSADARLLAPELGVEKVMSNAKITRDLGMSFRPYRETFIGMGYDILAMGLAKKDKTNGIAKQKQTTLESVMNETLVQRLLI